MDTAADEGAKEVRAHQPISEQTLDDVAHGLQLMGAFLSHPVSLAWLDSGAPAHNHREWCAGVVHQEEPLFPPSNWQFGNREVEVWVNSQRSADICLCSPTPLLLHLSPTVARRGRSSSID
jgi:hypothetical protein